MNYQAFLIKYAEIGIKGKNRYVFEDALMSQIRHALNAAEGDFTVVKENGRVYVLAEGEYDYEETIEVLQRVFGIAWVCPVVQVDDEGFEKLRQDCVNFMKAEYPEGTYSFKVEARRARKNYPVPSQEMNADIGEAILLGIPGTSVDVHHPDVRLFVEVRDRAINIYSKMIPGAGGMPVGTNGKAMLLLSGGIDSPVAGYMISKRGVVLEAVYFSAPPYTSDRATEKVVELAKLVSKYSGPIRLHIINFTEIQLYIYEKCPHDELTIIMRRYMMRIAEALAEKNGCQGLITGESIGQVASQTMHSLACTNDVCTMPVFRPVIGFDKQEIVDVALKINTYDTSVLPYEDCCTIFVAKHPVTKPNVNVIRRSENKLSEQIDRMVQTALDTEEIVVCK